MIAQQGRIESIDGDEAVVRIGATSGCPACDEGKGCGAGIFGRLLRNKPVSVRAVNDIGAQVGEAVQLGIAEGGFLRLVFRLYALPVLAGLTGVALGFTLAVRSGLEAFALDALSLVFGVTAAGLAMLWSRRGLREFTAQTAVHLMRVAEPPSSAACISGAPSEFAQPQSFVNQFDK